MKEHQISVGNIECARADVALMAPKPQLTFMQTFMQKEMGNYFEWQKTPAECH
jgi:hypothetical protein